MKYIVTDQPQQSVFIEVIDYEEKSVENAKIAVSINDTTNPHILSKGDVLEASREVEIAVIPDRGYYIEGADETDDIYRERMKYSKWEKEHEKILSKHAVKKIWQVTLDSNDDYGICAYYLDGEEVSGKVNIREGQELTLVYSIKNTDYEIGRSGIGGFWEGMVHKETENCTISVSEELDGKVVKRQVKQLGPETGL